MNKMGLMNNTSKRKLLLFAFILFQLVNNSITGQRWSIAHILNGDSSVYKFSQDKIIQGKPVDFFFPAYKFNQASSTKVIESVHFENKEIIEIAFDSKIPCERIDLEIDLYAESIDSIYIFLKTADRNSVPINQLIARKGYSYLPTIFFSVNLAQDNLSSGITSIQIVGISKDETAKFILGRLNGLKKIELIADNIQKIDSCVSKYPFDQQSDVLYELPGKHLKLHGFNQRSQLVLHDCHSMQDSIQCISQFTDKLLNEYCLYDAYSINKNEMLSRNALLTETASDIDSYYKGMKEIVASLNCCHIRLTTNQMESAESPSQPIYFYNIKNEIVVTAIFDPTLNNKIQLGDRLLSINNVPLEQLYKDFSKYVFASTPHQQEMKITQRLLYTAMETWKDSLLLEFQNNTGKYAIYLTKTNFSNKRVIPQGFKVASNDMIEKYDHIIYFRPDFREYTLNPLLYSHKEDFNNCKGLIVDLRGNSGGDLSCLTFFSFLISENSPILYNESNLFNVHSTFIIKPSNFIQIQAPIAVIVDARTTCMSELLINTLRKNKLKICVIGASNTAGSAQLSMATLLPKNALLAHFDGITKDTFGNIIDDNTGVVPDLLIRLESCKDLFPYDDKLKQIALDYLKDKNSVNEYISTNILFF
jgi:hypothetical protein